MKFEPSSTYSALSSMYCKSIETVGMDSLNVDSQILFCFMCILEEHFNMCSFLIQVFKQLFNEGLDLQKQRIRELRRYAKEQREIKAKKNRDQVESIEN